MQERISHWLTPPQFEDAERQWNARITHTLSLTLVGAAIVAALLTFLRGEYPGGIIILCGILLILGAFLCNRQGNVRLASFIVVFVLLFVTTMLLAAGNGIHDLVIMLYPVVLILASILLNRRGFLIIVVLAVLSAALIVTLEVNQQIVTPFSSITDYSDIVILAIILVITSIALRFLADNLRQSIVRARQNERAVSEINKRLQEQAEERTQRMQRVQQQQAALAALATFDAVIQGDLVRTYRHVTEVLAQVIDVERTSIWQLDAKRQVLQCCDLYQKSSGQHTTDAQCSVRSFPRYIQTMQASQTLMVHDVMHDPRVEELREGHLKPLGITGMLDVTIRQQGAMVGLVACEQVGEVRTWEEDEASFATVVADQVTQAMLNNERNRAEESIRRLNTELEQRVTKRTAELEAKARELETFAYSVSHDLKAPLRGIDGYSKLLLEDYGHLLEDDGKQFLETIRSATFRMNQLINDLLAYSRLERRMVVVIPVHVRELVEQILEEKAIELNERNVQVDLDFPCETIAAEIEGLTQALRNLIDNALKFTHGTAEPRIDIRCESQEEGCLVWVKDNGIGFEMQYHDRIFEIFQRLHRSEDYPGTGIGLALVRKAMLRMGGRVWAESEPGRGATFYLLFPWRDMEDIASSQ